LKANAETDFRNAFERLKTGDTIVLPKNSAVTQNNVAREAGRDPSALRKSRYPKLISDIQLWIAAGAEIPRATRDMPVAQLRSKLEDVMHEAEKLREERDLVLSKLLVANDRILLLTSKIKEDSEPGKGPAPIVFT